MNDARPLPPPDQIAALTPAALLDRAWQEAPVWLSRVAPQWPGDWALLVRDFLAMPGPTVHREQVLLHLGHAQGLVAAHQGLESPSGAIRFAWLMQLGELDANRLMPEPGQATPEQPGPLPPIALTASGLSDLLRPHVQGVLGVFQREDRARRQAAGEVLLPPTWRPDGELEDYPLPSELAGAVLPQLAELLMALVPKAPLHALRALAPLRRAGPPGLRGRVIGHYVSTDTDLGTLDIIQSYLRDPGLMEARHLAEAGGEPLLHALSRHLARWARLENKVNHSLRAWELACSTLQTQLRTRNPGERLAPAGRGWFRVEALMDALLPRKTGEAILLFAEMANAGFLHPALRARALSHHNQMSGVVLPNRAKVVAALLADPDLPPGEDCLAPLVSRQLLTPEELFLTLDHPRLGPLAQGHLRQMAAADSRFALDRLIAWQTDPLSNGPAILALVEGLMEALRPEALPSLRSCLTTLLSHLPQRNDPTVPLPARALGRTLAGYLAALGGAAQLAPENLNPWDAMVVHWQRVGLNNGEVVTRLAQGGALPQNAAAPGSRGELSARARFAQLCQGRLLCLETLTQLPPGTPRHARLFEQLAARLEPPLVLDRATEVAEGEQLSVVVHYRGSGFRFQVQPAPGGLDSIAVVRAFNRLLHHLQRPEWIFRLGSEDPADADPGALLSAHRQGFPPVAAALGLPLVGEAR